MGNCCRYGDAGAPLEKDEVEILQEIILKINSYLREEGRVSISEQGTSVMDFEGEMVTPLINGQECAYTILEGNILRCAIEKAWSDGVISFRKPLSCHLFPVRIKKYENFTAVNVEDWHICFPAREKGRREGVYVYQFLKDALRRAFGENVYMQLCIAARELRNID